MNTRLAVPVADNEIFQHFGKASQFKIYTISGAEVTQSETMDAETAGHAELGLWLMRNSINTVICGDIGPGALGALAVTGIKVFAGVEGDADEAVARFLAGELSDARTATCMGHSGEGGCSGHGCGGCRSHGCGCGGR
jgi:predicted Fe-Mo cluster-binding NifX family protein